MTHQRMSDISQKRLLAWYVHHHRKFPWRETRDPYRILVSEVMLQQTQADRVVPKYTEFLDRFPTLHVLASAPAGDVIRAWAGLGYNRRALNLQRACRAVVERFDGVIPSDPADLISLPGIGPYTAGAIACFAFEQDVGFVDTNIRRVIHRVLVGPELPAPEMTTRQVDDAARDLVPAGEGYVWNQALIELGAVICRARTVDCDRCPFQDDCRARPTIQTVLATVLRGVTRSEPKFETTNRFVRGRIVDALRLAGDDGLSLPELDVAVGSNNGTGDPLKLLGVVRGLRADGLLVDVNDQQRLVAEEPMPFDAGELDLTRRYRLPD